MYSSRCLHGQHASYSSGPGPALHHAELLLAVQPGQDLLLLFLLSSAVMAAAIGQCTAKTVLRCPHASLAPCSSRLCALKSVEGCSSKAQGPAARPARSTVLVRAASGNGTSPASSGLAINLTGTCCMIRPHACSKVLDSSLQVVAAGKKAFIAGVADDQVRIWAQ